MSSARSASAALRALSVSNSAYLQSATSSAKKSVLAKVTDKTKKELLKVAEKEGKDTAFDAANEILNDKGKKPPSKDSVKHNAARGLAKVVEHRATAYAQQPTTVDTQQIALRPPTAAIDISRQHLTSQSHHLQIGQSTFTPSFAASAYTASRPRAGGGKKKPRKNYDDCTVPELRKKAKSRAITLKKDTKKANIIAALRKK